ncbi:MAG TPA: hypothetical protein PKL69_10330, partial [Agitococcus sp.]|nr:hypothetical protein [Agitococcus sp.]
PQLPGGYASMLLPAYVPSLWYKLMDERVIKHYNGDLSKINMDPDEQGFLMQKYAPLAKRIKEENEQTLIEATPEAA